MQAARLLSVDDPGQAGLLARFGKHRMTKSSLYLKHLADLDVAVLEVLVSVAVATVQRRFG